MKVKLLALTVTLLIIQFRISNAQEILRYCGTDEFMQSVYAKNPNAKIQQQQLELFTQQYHVNEHTRQIYIIPVVFHIIHNYGVENISDAQVRDAVRILNEDFNKQNADTSSIVSAFLPIAANCGFEFRLATIDLNGNCTNGIEHIQSGTTYAGGEQSKVNPWPADKYLNIWVTKEIANGAAGYTYLPGTANPDADGIIILSRYVGSIGTGNAVTARALTHEVGHWFNLLHTWGEGNSPGVACGDDHVNDTPETKGWTSCNLTGASCNSALDNVQNYMDYTYCYCMFTNGQKTRMIATLNNSIAGRNNLWSNSNLIATGTANVSNAVICKPVADFTASSYNICVSDSVKLSDISWNGKVLYRFWDVPGATASSIADSVISVSYSIPGSYTVTLYAGNNSGSDFKTRTAFIFVHSDSGDYANGYEENFEDNVFPDSDYQPENSFDINWYLNSTVGYSGYHCLALKNILSTSGQKYSVDGPSFNLSTFSNPALTFHVAYAQQSAADNDKLRVLISLNCGKNWSPRYSKSGSQLATVSLQTNNFVPTASQWRTETVNLPMYANATNLRIKFELTSGGGNNIYIDDINMGGYSATENIIGENEMQIIPNPVSDDLKIKMNLIHATSGKIKIVDVTGRVIAEIFSGIINKNQIISYPASNISPGLYLVELETVDQKNIIRFVKM